MNKSIFLIPKHMSSFLIKKLRKDDPFLDLKTFSKEELIESFYGTFDSIALNEIMLFRNIDEDKASLLLKFLPYIKNNDKDSKIHELWEVKQHLISLNLYHIDSYVSSYLKDQSIEVIGYSSFDKELSTLFSLLNIKAHFNKEVLVKSNQKVTIFDNARDETLFVLNSIADLIYKGVQPRDIKIIANKDYHYYLSIFSQNFGLLINLDNNTSFYSQEFVCQFLDLVRTYQDFNHAYELLIKDDIDADNLQILKKIIDSTNDERFLFQKRLAFLIASLKKRTIHYEKYKDAIDVHSSPLLLEDGHIFVLGFNEGTYPQIYQDNDYLSDMQKEQIGINTSFEKGVISNDLFSSFFGSKNQFYFSFAKTLLTNHFQLSPLFKAFHMSEITWSTPSTFYSSLYAKLLLASKRDLYKFYKEYSKELDSLPRIVSFDYDSYQNGFSGLVVNNKYKQKKHSYSSINAYYSCPFKYYLSSLLNIDKDQQSFTLSIGNVFHHIIEKKDSGLSFDELFEREINEEQYNWTINEKNLLENLKRLFHIAFDSIKLHDNHYMNNPTFLYEEKLSFKLDEFTSFEGRIDKIVTINKEYIILIDYKTGSESFSLKALDYGRSLQLPSYALLIENTPSFNDYEIAGLYINQILPSSSAISKKEEDLTYEHLLLKGISLNDFDALKQIDTTFMNGGSSSFIKNLKMNKNGSFYHHFKGFNKEEIHSFADKAKKMIIEAASKIRNNEFPISPTFINKNDKTCQYCSFADICYVKDEQKILLYKEMEEE